jgi:hypothetical protein
LDTLNCIHDLQNVKNFYSKSWQSQIPNAYL